MNGTTPNVGFTLGTDATENANWEKIDALVGLLSGPGVILPGDTEVQGNLQVDGAATIASTLQAGDTIVHNLTANAVATIAGLLTAGGGLTVGGAVTFPPLSIGGAALAKGASLQGLWLGTANTTKQPLGVAPAIAFNTVAIDAREDVSRWELVIAQVTTEIAAVGNPAFTVTWTLRRGTTDMQSRVLTYTSTSTQATTVDIPLTMVRLQQITAPLAQTWSLMGSSTISGGSVYHTFSQLYALQFA